MKRRFLCVCNSGAVRSVTLARLLKKFEAETLSIGCKDNSAETMELLCEWADRIFVAEARMAKHIPERHQGKVSLEYVTGPDFWFYPGHPDLVGVYRNKIELFPPGQLTEPKAE